MNTTISEVAKKANTSVATVSRVMNGNYPVKEETKQRVLKAIEELNYIPNIQARELTQKKSTTIGVIVPSLTNLFFPTVIYGIESELKKHSFSIILMTTSNNQKEEEKCVMKLLSRNVAGIIVVDPNTSNIKNKLYDKLSKKIPFVFINGSSNVKNVSSVSNDESIGCELALNYLLDNNHRDILFIRGENSYSYDIKEKVYKDMMMKINNFHHENIINIGEGNSLETVDSTTSILLKTLPKLNVTAIFACNDLMGVGAINACKKLNLDVPKDLSIIGYDNIQLCSLIEPKLTTMDQNMYLLGTNAANLIKDKIDCNNDYSKRIILNNSLVERDTVKKIL